MIRKLLRYVVFFGSALFTLSFARNAMAEPRHSEDIFRRQLPGGGEAVIVRETPVDFSPIKSLLSKRSLDDIATMFRLRLEIRRPGSDPFVLWSRNHLVGQLANKLKAELTVMEMVFTPDYVYICFADCWLSLYRIDIATGDGLEYAIPNTWADMAAILPIGPKDVHVTLKPSPDGKQTQMVVEDLRLPRHLTTLFEQAKSDPWRFEEKR